MDYLVILDSVDQEDLLVLLGNQDRLDALDNLDYQENVAHKENEASQVKLVPLVQEDLLDQ